MSNGPHIWDINEDIIIELTVLDPNTGLGLTGQTSFIILSIQKASNSYYWTGTTYLPGFSTVSMTEVDSTNEPGRYRYTLPAFPGNTAADIFYAHANVDNPPTVQGDDYDVHVSRDSSNVKLYEAEPEYIIRSE